MSSDRDKFDDLPNKLLYDDPTQEPLAIIEITDGERSKLFFIQGERADLKGTLQAPAERAKGKSQVGGGSRAYAANFEGIFGKKKSDGLLN